MSIGIDTVTAYTANTYNTINTKETAKKDSLCESSYSVGIPLDVIKLS